MSENNAFPVLQEPLEAALRHTAFSGYRHTLGSGETVGQFREYCELRLGQGILADDALHLRGGRAKILGKAYCPLHRILINQFLLTAARPIGEGQQERKADSVDFEFACNGCKGITPVGVATVGLLVLPLIEAVERIRRERNILGDNLTVAVSLRNYPDKPRQDFTPCGRDVKRRHPAAPVPFRLRLVGREYIGIFSKWRKIEVVKWAEDAIYAPIQTTDDKNRSLR